MAATKPYTPNWRPYNLSKDDIMVHISLERNAGSSWRAVRNQRGTHKPPSTKDSCRWLALPLLKAKCICQKISWCTRDSRPPVPVEEAAQIVCSSPPRALTWRQRRRMAAFAHAWTSGPTSWSVTRRASGPGPTTRLPGLEYAPEVVQEATWAIHGHASAPPGAPACRWAIERKHP